MKFIVSSSNLLKKLQVLGGVVNSKNTLPILDNFLFELSENQLKITASDLETTMSSVVEVMSENKGNIAVSVRLLTDALKTLPDQPLTFKTNEEENTLEIISEHGKYNMAYYSDEEYPKPVVLDSPKTTFIPSKVLNKAINNTIFAAGNDELRPTISGVLFDFSTEGATFVATDAHKLVKYDRTDIASPEDAKFIVPKKTLNLLKTFLSSSDTEVNIEYNNVNAKITFDDTTLICRLIDGEYPNYEAVIPDENPNKLKINRALFLNAVRRVSVFSSMTTHQISLKIAGTELKISGEDVDFFNKANENLNCEYVGDNMSIGFNSRYLIEMLDHLISDEVLIEMSSYNRAGILSPLNDNEKGEKTTMLLMPILINS